MLAHSSKIFVTENTLILQIDLDLLVTHIKTNYKENIMKAYNTS